MVSIAHALAREALVRTLTAYSGITTEDGAFDGTATLVDSNLIGRNDFIKEKTILIMSGDAKDEDKGATAFDNTDGKITLQGTGFSHQIKKGTIFRVLNISSIEIDVANMDAKIGTNTDPAGTTTLFAWLARLFAVGGQGLVYYGKVTTYTDTTHFKVSGLTGFGDTFFKNYRAYVVRDAAGLGDAPQGEMQPISDYVSSDGTFTHTDFTTPLAVDDEVLILHERIAEIKDIHDYIDAMLDLTRDGGTVTATGPGTEDNVYINDAPAANYTGIVVLIDLSNLGAGDSATVREYYRIKDGGSYIKKDQVAYSDAQDPALIRVTLEPNRYGAKVTIEATATRTFDWEVFTIE